MILCVELVVHVKLIIMICGWWVVWEENVRD